MKIPSAKEYPKTLKINNAIYSIKFRKRMPTSGVSGLCDGTNKVIYIAANNIQSEIFKTFIHEVLHAMEFEYRIKIEHEAIHQFEDAISDFLLMNF